MGPTYRGDPRQIRLSYQSSFTAGTGAIEACASLACLGRRGMDDDCRPSAMTLHKQRNGDFYTVAMCYR
jgi:hypothetical protein